MARKRRSSKSSSGIGSGGALLVIVALGAAGWWTAYDGKHPELSRLLSQFPSLKKTEEAKARLKAPVAPAKPQENGAKTSVALAAKADAPRPPLPIRPVAIPSRDADPQIMPPRPPAPINATETKSVVNIPVGKPDPATTPSAFYARERVVIREHAWDKSAAIGTVERGREMRSYGKTGKWHRVVVPSTSMIGWVHENQLASSPPFFTGSIFKK
ncbi:hypothetical protein [Brucella sp. IR073]|uniref:hypothetical protein n=1 Tax=unclassified Brucella TaxID=2632610 RepID=UPI003B97E19A